MTVDLLKETDGIGNGRFTKELQNWFEEQFNINKVLLTTSGTSALEMSAILGNFNYGDEVIMPSYTFPTTASAFVREGCKPVFVDINLYDLNINVDLIEEAITSKTKAIVPVHYAGFHCDMYKIMEIAKKYNLLVIEDAAQCFDSFYDYDKHLGSIGDLGIISFHGTKNVSCGEGGAIFINNPSLIERAEIIWEKGTNRNKMLRGEIDKYSWVDLGSSFLMSDYLVGILAYTIFNNYSYTERSKKYFKYLKEFSKFNYCMIPLYGKNITNTNFHIFYILLNINNYRCDRDKVLRILNNKGIKVSSHYEPLHLSDYGKQFGEYYLPVTEFVSESIIRFPMDLNIDEIEDVIKITKDVIINESTICIS